jgi:hypothetical protein
VNREDTLFAYLPHLPEKLEQMRGLLHDPITADEAQALDDVLYRRHRYADLIAWLGDEPVSWPGYFVREEFRAVEHDRQLLAEWKKEDEDRANGIEPPMSEMAALWAAVLPPPDPEEIAERNPVAKAQAMEEYLPRASSCPNCGTPPEHLEWSRFHARTCGGWQTHCRFCLRQVDAFIGVMVTPARRLKRPDLSLRDGSDIRM